MLAIGEARERVAAALAAAAPVVDCESLREAVERAFALGAPGDTVLLAPGCSSFDMFRDYAERGRVFKAEVERLARKAGKRNDAQNSQRAPNSLGRERMGGARRARGGAFQRVTPPKLN